MYINNKLLYENIIYKYNSKKNNNLYNNIINYNNNIKIYNNNKFLDTLFTHFFFMRLFEKKNILKKKRLFNDNNNINIINFKKKKYNKNLYFYILIFNILKKIKLLNIKLPTHINKNLYVLYIDNIKIFSIYDIFDIDLDIKFNISILYKYNIYNLNILKLNI